MKTSKLIQTSILIKTIVAMKKIVDTNERFIGYYHNHRISIAKIENSNNYDFDISDKNNIEIFKQDIMEFPDICECINHCKDYVDTKLSIDKEWEKIIIV